MNPKELTLNLNFIYAMAIRNWKLTLGKHYFYSDYQHYEYPRMISHFFPTQERVDSGICSGLGLSQIGTEKPNSGPKQHWCCLLHFLASLLVSRIIQNTLPHWSEIQKSYLKMIELVGFVLLIVLSLDRHFSSLSYPGLV